MIVHLFGQMFIKMDKLLDFFIKEPEKEFHVRELAKITKKSPTTIAKYLGKLKKEGLLYSRRKFGRLLYRADVESGNFRDRKFCYNIKYIRKSGLIAFLEEEFNHPEAIVLFGSFAHAENSKRSDIDILVVSSLKKEVGLVKYEKRLGASIQLFVHEKKEIKQMKNKELVNKWVNGVVLSGFWELV
jgi:predicted nucleotidyltransferase